MTCKSVAPSCRAAAGFTLIELLVVIVIILIISAITLPTVVPALSHRQVSEAARILQSEIVGARDRAIRNNAPSGIRLMPDTGIPLTRITATSSQALGQIDTTQPLVYNRIVTLDQGPDYSNGRVFPQSSAEILMNPAYASFPYPGAGGGYYPASNLLMVKETVYSAKDDNTLVSNDPTSWYWNIRVGDKIQLNSSGTWYTVVGPMNVTPASGNSEMFVNIGSPGTLPPRSFISDAKGNFVFFNPEFLFLVNGQDDNSNGLTDEGWDGIDNDGKDGVDDLGEWESENWTGALLNNSVNPAVLANGVPYTIRRRPVPSSTPRASELPTNVVIDATTGVTNLASSGYGLTTPSLERSRLPVNPYSGYVEIMVNPDGSVRPASLYSSPASLAMASAFYHFWIGERADVMSPNANSITKGAPYLPIPVPNGVSPAKAPYPVLKGEYRLVTLFTRTGMVTTNDDMPFDNPASPANGSSYNVNMPFVQAQQSIVSGF
jgi:prepilin-type N-terminal cleavage/methylation domain-containing protein